jgi:hypothetical protein
MANGKNDGSIPDGYQRPKSFFRPPPLSLIRYYPNLYRGLPGGRVGTILGPSKVKSIPGSINFGLPAERLIFLQKLPLMGTILGTIESIEQIKTVSD